MKISVTPDRLLELLELLKEWRFKSYMTRRQLESLIGKIQFVTKLRATRAGYLYVKC